jgi:TolB protein
MPHPMILAASLLALSTEGDPSFSQSRLAAVRVGKTARELWSLRPDGSDLRKMHHSTVVMGGPSWSSDGKHVLFTERSGIQADLYSLPVGGGPKQLISRAPGLNADAEISVNNELALVLSRDGNSEIYLLDGANYRRLTNEWTLDGAPSWSPMGERIAFTSARAGATELFLMKRDGSGAKKLTSFGLTVQQPDWSPVEEKVVFAVRENERSSDLWILDVQSGELTQLTNNPGVDSEPTYSPNGRWIAFVSDRSGHRDLWVMPAAGGTAAQITTGGDYQMPAWSPSTEVSPSIAMRAQDILESAAHERRDAAAEQIEAGDPADRPGRRGGRVARSSSL